MSILKRRTILRKHLKGAHEWGNVADRINESVDLSSLVTVGLTLKSVVGGVGKIGSYSILFTTPDDQDFHGNNFTKNTYLGQHKGDGMDVTFNHRLPLFDGSILDKSVADFAMKMQDRVMKNPVHTRIDEVGVFSELVCDLSDKYEKAVYDLANAGKLKWSSATAPHLFKAKKNGELEMFIIAEQALTPIPAEYRMIEHKVMPMKSFIDFLKGGAGSGENEGHPFRGNQYTSGTSGRSKSKREMDKGISNIDTLAHRAQTLIQNNRPKEAIDAISEGYEELDMLREHVDPTVDLMLERYAINIEENLDEAEQYLDLNNHDMALSYADNANNELMRVSYYFATRVNP